ncbi:MAG TPA: MoaD/ThiS family protein [bacterium]|nr:MoaD/ThiS family protein [bacterium]HEX68447.1 MoaD/ThiS family protein [bacterium]
MQVKVNGEIKEVRGKKRVGEILEELGLNREEVLVIKNGELLTESDWVEENEEIEVMRVVSGG